MPSHEYTSTAGLGGALSPQSLDLAIAVNLVVLEYCHLDLFADVLDLLGSGVGLLFTLLGSSSQSQHQLNQVYGSQHDLLVPRCGYSEAHVEGGLLLDVVVREGSAVLELLSGEDQSLLVRGLQGSDEYVSCLSI